MPSTGPDSQGPGEGQLSPGRGQTGKCGATSEHETPRPGNHTWPRRGGGDRRGWRAGPRAGCLLSNKWPFAGSHSLSLPSQGSKRNKPPAGRQLCLQAEWVLLRVEKGRGENWTVPAPVGRWLTTSHYDPVRQVLLSSHLTEEETDPGAVKTLQSPSS